MGVQAPVGWKVGRGDLCVRRQRTCDKTHRVPHVAGGQVVWIGVQQKRGSRRFAKADFTLPNTRALGGDGDSHRGWKGVWDGFAREVGEDQAPHSGDAGDGVPGQLPPGKTAADQRLPDVCGKDLPMDQPLHEGVAPHDRQLEASPWIGRIQTAGEGAGECTGTGF